MKKTGLSLLLCLFTNVYASDVETIIHGGRLYDSWWTDTKLQPPSSTHPSYQKGKQSGSSTWRCKECHGWDYQGKDGAYRNGSHFSDIKGIRDASGKPENEIASLLGNKQHGFDKLISKKDLEAIAAFVSKGQIDMTQYISLKTKKSNGDSKKGRSNYLQHCADCHGEKGDSLNLASDKTKTEYIGNIANKNPWETLHKIRFGHPGAVMGMQIMHNNMMGRHHHRAMRNMWQSMPPMLDTLTVEEQNNLLAYLQTLPH